MEFPVPPFYTKDIIAHVDYEPITARFLCLAKQEFGHVDPIDDAIIGDLAARNPSDRREKIHLMDYLVADASSLDLAGPADHEGDAKGPFIPRKQRRSPGARGAVYCCFQRHRRFTKVQRFGTVIGGKDEYGVISDSQIINRIRGIGFMLGIELNAKEKIPAFSATDKSVAVQMVDRLHAQGLLTVPAGNQVIRLLPSLNLSRAEAKEAIDILDTVLASVQS